MLIPAMFRPVRCAAKNHAGAGVRPREFREPWQTRRVEGPVTVLVDRYPSLGADSPLPAQNAPPRHLHEDPLRHIDIGLVNNMPDTAMEATVRQFHALLGAADDSVVIHLKLFSMPGVPSSDWRRQHLDAHYLDFDDLWDMRLDGLIVTGTEPRAADLAAEPYWAHLSKLVDWAEENTAATVWSCLAAHAAVLHLDGIKRSPLRQKCFGLFQHVKASNHPLLEGQSSPILTPHSRWNELSEEALVSSGYRVLSTSTAAGVDIFVKERKSLFLFFQGHPEYEADTLAREHRRDVGRFLRGERDSYPDLPERYFDPAATEMLNAFRARALTDRREELLSAFPTEQTFGNVPHAWHAQALHTYRNWLNYIVECKASQTQPAPPARRAG
jgi:homoserine O-succinyltransferase